MFRPRSRSTRRRRLAVALGVMLTLVSCDDEPQGPACPDRTARDPERLARLHQRLTADPDARALVIATHGRYVVCFGEGTEAGVDAQHRLLLDRSQDDAPTAAKLGHLLLHVSQGLPFEDADRRSCEQRLTLARDREQAAHALESSLRVRFGLPALEDDALERVMAGYRARCRDSTSK